jgi:hypothetical protein
MTDDSTQLEARVANMRDHDADLVAAENWILARREVVNAVGSIDEGFERTQPALVDFCLKARQRNFRCVAVGNAGVATRSLVHESYPESDWRRLRQKWADYPELIENE